MININKPKPEFINRIVGIICLEKGLSKNTKIAYMRDINLVFDWFINKNINCMNANEKTLENYFLF